MDFFLAVHYIVMEVWYIFADVRIFTVGCLAWKAVFKLFKLFEHTANQTVLSSSSVQVQTVTSGLASNSFLQLQQLVVQCEVFFKVLCLNTSSLKMSLWVCIVVVIRWERPGSFMIFRCQHKATVGPFDSLLYKDYSLLGRGNLFESLNTKGWSHIDIKLSKSTHRNIEVKLFHLNNVHTGSNHFPCS